MSSIFDKLVSKQLITDFPSHLKHNVQYECITGSVSYGVSDDNSDMDICGFSIPAKHILFPYSNGHVVGFGKKPENFEQFQKHHIIDKSANKEYDITIYSIVKYFQLCMENNPNMVDSLFVPTRCVLHSTSIGEHVRSNRKLFLSKRVFHKFKGYAFAQLHKMKSKHVKTFVMLCNEFDIPYDLPMIDTVKLMEKNGASNDVRVEMVQVIGKIETNGNRSKRIPLIAKHGYDTKFAYHIVRLLDECQMILEEGDLDLTRSRAHLKAIRKGEVKEEAIVEYFDSKLISLENLYNNSKLPFVADEIKIKKLLLECLEMHFGSLDGVVSMEETAIKYIHNAHVELEKAMKYLK